MHRHPDTQLPTTDPINVTYSTTPGIYNHEIIMHF